MRREPIVKYRDKKFIIEGYEVLADFPQLIVNEDIDFNVFKINLNLVLDVISKENLKYHLNLNGKTLIKYKDKIFDLLSKIKNEYKEKIILELLENSISISESEKIIENLRRLNIKISLDDFGTSSSNIDRLLFFKDILDSVKIDRILWKNLPDLSLELLRFCKKNDVSVIFEKVETQEEINFLTQNGADTFQGWYFKQNLLNKIVDSTINYKEDQELLVQIFRDAVNIVNNNNIDEIVQTFKILKIAHDLNIKVGTDEFFQLREKFLLNQEKNPHLIDKNLSKIVAILNAELLYYIKDLESFKKDIKKFLYNIDIPKELNINVTNFLNKTKSISEELKHNYLELKALNSCSNEKYGDDNGVINRKEFEFEISFKIKEFKRTKNYFVVGYIYIPTLENIIRDYGYHNYNKTFSKIITTIKNSIGKDYILAILDNFTVSVIYEGNNPIKLKRIVERVSNSEMKLDKEFINLEAKGCGTVVRESDEKSDDIIQRLNGLLYESKNYSKDQFLFE